jgi:hypothetical protein
MRQPALHTKHAADLRFLDSTNLSLPTKHASKTLKPCPFQFFAKCCDEISLISPVWRTSCTVNYTAGETAGNTNL